MTNKPIRHVEIYKKRLVYRIKIVAGNGEVLMHSEAYFSKSNAQRAAVTLSRALGLAING